MFKKIWSWFEGHKKIDERQAMKKEIEYKDDCFCGENKFTHTGRSEVMAYYHYESCRHLMTYRKNSVAQVLYCSN